MKRILPVILILCLLTGCAQLRPDSHVTIQPHVEQTGLSDDANIVVVEDYLGLRTAILDCVREYRNRGRIRINAYDGDVETDLTEAVYTVSKQDPLGAYAVDYMTYESVRIVSYYEITINITYRRSKEEIAAVERVLTTVDLQERLDKAVENCETKLTLNLNSWWEQDVAAMVASYSAKHPDTVMEAPQVAVTVYPETGASRILEITLTYSLEPQQLLDQKRAVAQSLDGAANYIRYRETEMDKVRLLYTYLTSRFNYAPGEAVTPLYAALCAGVADPTGLSQALQLICDRSGVKCYTVTGMCSGQEYTWNIVSLDGRYYHLDLTRSMLEDGGLTLLDDAQMTDYHWSADRYPACTPPEPEPPAVEEPPVVEEPPIEEEPPAEEPSEEPETPEE